MNEAGKPILNGKKCVGCHLCLPACPKYAIATACKRIDKSQAISHRFFPSAVSPPADGLKPSSSSSHTEALYSRLERAEQVMAAFESMNYQEWAVEA